jgi:hypothetical protein
MTDNSSVTVKKELAAAGQSAMSPKREMADFDRTRHIAPTVNQRGYNVDLRDKPLKKEPINILQEAHTIKIPPSWGGHDKAN